MGHNNLFLLNVGSGHETTFINPVYKAWVPKSKLPRYVTHILYNNRYTDSASVERQKLSSEVENNAKKRSNEAISLLLFLLPSEKFALKRPGIEAAYLRPSLLPSRLHEGWSRPVTSIGKLPSSLDRKITLFRENNTLVSAAGAPRQHSLACVCASKSPRCRCQPEYKGSLYMISMHLCKTYWTKKPCPECCSTPINGLRNYFERRLVVRQLWYVAGEAFLLCSVPAMRPGHVLIIQQQEDICLYWVTRPRTTPPTCNFKSRKMGR